MAEIIHDQPRQNLRSKNTFLAGAGVDLEAGAGDAFLDVAFIALAGAFIPTLPASFAPLAAFNEPPLPPPKSNKPPKGDDDGPTALVVDLAVAVDFLVIDAGAAFDFDAIIAGVAAGAFGAAATGVFASGGGGLFAGGAADFLAAATGVGAAIGFGVSLATAGGGETFFGVFAVEVGGDSMPAVILGRASVGLDGFVVGAAFDGGVVFAVGEALGVGLALAGSCFDFFMPAGVTASTSLRNDTGTGRLRKSGAGIPIPSRMPRKLHSPLVSPRSVSIGHPNCVSRPFVMAGGDRGW